jgi:tetratricopeptide (TPR) repeat protein
MTDGKTIILTMAFLAGSAGSISAALLPTGTNFFRSLPAGPAFFETPDRTPWFVTRDQGLFQMRPDGTLKKEFQPPASVSLPAVPYGAGCLLFLENGSILKVGLPSGPVRELGRYDHRFLSASGVSEGSIRFLTEDSLLHTMSLSNGQIKTFGYATRPRRDAFLTVPRGILVRTEPGQAALFDRQTLAFLKYTNDSFEPGEPLFHAGPEGLFERNPPDRRWSYAAPLPPHPGQAEIFTNRGRLFVTFPEGVLLSFRISRTNLVRSLPLRPDLPAGLSLARFPDRTVLSGPSGLSLVLPPDAVPDEECADAAVSDLDADGLPDVCLLFRANRTMSYGRLIFAFSSAAPQEFSTIAADGFILTKILRDLDSDGRPELVLVKEMNINLDVRPDRRLLVPEVYRMEPKKGFVWASVRYPAFHEARRAETIKRSGRAPFEEEWKNATWKEMNAVILALQTELITLNRQIRQTSGRERDERAKAGLALWYYKKGLEMFRNRWDNLALLAFRHSLEQDPSNRRAAFQAGRIYAEYGLFEEAVRMLDSGRASDVVFIQNQNYYRMKEDRFPVLFDPDVFYRAYHAGEILYHTGRYERAAASFVRCLEAGEPDHPAVLREKARLMLADCYLALNRFGKAAEIYRKIQSERPGEESEYKLKLAERLKKATANR